jgi:hypothetical protein
LAYTDNDKAAEDITLVQFPEPFSVVLANMNWESRRGQLRIDGYRGFRVAGGWETVTKLSCARKKNLLTVSRDASIDIEADN